jgi:hypothetical protein
MTVTVSPFQAGLGADISGVEHPQALAAPPTATRSAPPGSTNLVLRFRGEPMTDEQHMAFTASSRASNSTRPS